MNPFPGAASCWQADISAGRSTGVSKRKFSSLSISVVRITNSYDLTVFEIHESTESQVAMCASSGL